MEFNIADIKSLIKAKENESLTVFVGAGFSKFSETDTIKFPDWGELMRSLKKDLQTDETDYLKLAQLYFLEFGEYKLYEKLKENIPLYAMPSDLHKSLFDLNPKYIITTNWDNLLEDTVNEQGLIYDVIKSDADFVKSTLPQKVIKIHGDLETHNIVFKEDDFLNYSLNNPLLDNFVRHILSSTTVLFLGYSYNDNNLKQIIKWIEKHSEVSPPRFLLTLKNNPSQDRYLENHHIKVITPNDYNNANYSSLYNEFFNYLNNFEEIIIFKINSDTDVIDYFIDKLNTLTELKSILPYQIIGLFPDTSEEYHLNCFGIWLHKDIATLNNSVGARKIYGLFFNILQKIKNDTLKDKVLLDKVLLILQYFFRANIFYIQYDGYVSIYEVAYKILFPKMKFKFSSSNIISSDIINKEKFICYKVAVNIIAEDYFLKSTDIDKIYRDFLQFSPNMPRKLFAPMLFEGANEKLEFIKELGNLLSIKKREKNFIQSLICHFNYNHIAHIIIRDFNIEEKERQSFSDYVRSRNYELSLEKYPYKVRKQLKSVLDFLTFKIIYEFYYDASVDNLKNSKQAKSNKNLGAKLNFHSKEQRSNNRVSQVLKFVATNEIYIDFYSEFKSLMQSYITGSFEIQAINKQFELKIHDLFILIKYLDLNDLLSLIDKNILFDYKDNPKSQNIIFSQDEKEYLVTTFTNLCEIFRKHPTSFQETTISHSLINCIILLSLINWEIIEIESIINQIYQLFTEYQMPYDSYKAINLFVFYNYRIYSINHTDFTKLLDIPLQKIIENSLNFEYHAIKSYFNNPFGYLNESRIKYSNISLMKKVIAILKVYDNQEQQRQIVKDILIKYLGVTDKATKKILESYINKIRVTDWKVGMTFNPQAIAQEIMYNIYGMKVSEKFIEYLNSVIEDIVSDPTMVNFAMRQSEIIALIKIMSEENKNKDYQKIYNRIREKKS